jgi:SAM-dependent methyltransferase
MNDPQPHDTGDLADTLFQLQADLDFTKHLGGQTATDLLVELCQIGSMTRVLDVGCGVGITPCNLSKARGCHIVGVDLRESLIRRARDRAHRSRLEDQVQFRVADVRNLPFEDSCFDVVMAESVLAFVGDKPAAIRECLRVTREEGFLGITEATWLGAPPQRIVDSLSSTFGPGFAVLDTDGWQALLEGSGARDVAAISHRITALSESRDRLRRLGFQQYARVWLRSLSLARRSPEYRNLPRGALSDPRELINYWGYGIYVGRK